MTVLIAKANEAILKQMAPNIEFKEATKNTSTFTITPFKFKILYQTIKARGYNPYSLLSW